MISISQPLPGVRVSWVFLLLPLAAALSGCASSTPGTTTTPSYTLTVGSTTPATGVPITVSPADNAGLVSGSTALSLKYPSGTSVNLAALVTYNGNLFTGWTGCTSASGPLCTMVVTGDATVTANYALPPANYTLTVASTDPVSGVPVTALPADVNALASGNTSLALTYKAGTSVVLTAPATAGLEAFSKWTGCVSTSGQTCTVVVNSNATVTANYVSAATVTISPTTASAVLGASQQFTASVTGVTNTGVTWSVAAPAGSALSPGTISAKGLYQTPYPAPTMVTVTATSAADPAATASATITLTAPAAVSGPVLSVDTTTVTHTISPLIYGMNAYGMNTSLQAQLHIPVDRWGGDFTTRYNYLLDVSNSAADYYYENALNSNSAYPDTSQFNTQATRDKQYSSKTINSVPMIGYTTQRKSACSYSVAKYGAQKTTDPNNADCGLGIKLDGTSIVNDPTDTSTAIDQTFVSGWVTYLVKKFGAASAGGVGIYQLDNEPEYWGAVHKDVHPKALSYDELVTKGIAYATVIKKADPTALVSGPAISNYQNYFYSPLDAASGYTAPYYVYNSNPVDRLAHGDVPLIAYYLQQFAKADAAGAGRLLDYVDIHTYFAAAGAQFAPAGDTALQAARLNSTRVFWDPTYTDPAYTDPQVRTNKAPAIAVQVIPFLKSLASANYPGTKTAVTEYNWGAQESVNGAIAQADILGIFGQYGLDMGLLWGPPDPKTQVPGVLAFQLFQSYDGAGSTFGDQSYVATSADQSKLSIYAAKRTTDGAVTVLVLNKTFGDLTSTVTLGSKASSAAVYQYSNANPAAILKGTNLTVTATPGGGGSISTTFPAQSITLLVLPY